MSGPQGRSGRVRISSPPPPPGIRFPDRPARSKALYLLRYPRAFTNAAGRYIPRRLWSREALSLVSKCPALDPTVWRHNHFHFFYISWPRMGNTNNRNRGLGEPSCKAFSCRMAELKYFPSREVRAEQCSIVTFLSITRKTSA
jgi:hypothetical protein